MGGYGLSGQFGFSPSQALAVQGQQINALSAAGVAQAIANATHDAQIAGILAALAAAQPDGYIPILTGITNVGATNSFTTRFVRMGNDVLVSGYLLVTNLVIGSWSTLTVSLPIPSTFTDYSQCTGTFTTSEVNQSGIVLGTGTTASFFWLAQANTIQAIAFTFRYQVIP
jgi:hypothetical protein